MHNNIKLFRKERNYTLDKLAEMSGSSKSYIWELEAEKSIPNVRLAYAISKALQHNIETVFPDDQEYEERTITTSSLKGRG
jgi:transcriptional regulator with XRE-family HTH domain